MQMTLDPQAQADIFGAVLSGAIETWSSQDDLCDCTFQRIGMWRSPYLAETLEVRMCCIWADLYKQYPQFVRVIPGYFDEARNEWITEPREWNGDHEMPKDAWFRHLARKQDRSIADIRAEYESKDELRPKGKGTPRKEPAILYLNSGWGWLPLELGA